MHLSRYLKIWPCPDRAGHVILYSTKKGSVVRLPEAQLALLREGRLGERAASQLKRLEMVVDDPDAERMWMEEAVGRSSDRSTRFFAKVVLNLDCNLSCPYCFEGDFRRGQYMSQETASRLVDRVVGEQVDRGREVQIGFYGGEPLLSIPLLKEIAAGIGDAARRAGTPFSFSLTTNGTLLTRQVVEELKPLGLARAIVTLDGPQDIHDRQRPFVSGKGTFDAIVANVDGVCDVVQVDIVGNFSPGNYRRFPELLDRLRERGIDGGRLGQVEFAPIMPKSGRGAGREMTPSCIAENDPVQREAGPYLRREIRRRGFSTPEMSTGACIVEFATSLVVNYDGTLYKCPAFMGWPELSVGTLADGVKDYRDSHALGIWKNDECLDCAYLPLCFGGCRLLTLMRHGAIDRVDCRRAYYDAVLPELVMEDLVAPLTKKTPECRQPEIAQ